MLSLNLKGKKAFVVGIADDGGFGWAIAKSLAEAGATVIAGTWAPFYRVFTQSLAMGKFDKSRELSNGNKLEFAAILPIDALYDKHEDAPEDIKENKRYKDLPFFAVSDVANAIKEQFGEIDILVHSLANSPEVQKPLLETSRQGYLAALSSSSYSLISLVSHFGPLMPQGSSVLSLTYVASDKVIPGYGGGMNSAKAALESDTRTLAWDAGKKWGIRINTISAGAASTRAGKAIGFIDRMINYSIANSPLGRSVEMENVGNAAAFLCSPLAAAITGSTLFVDQGLNIMGVAIDSPSLA